MKRERDELERSRDKKPRLQPNQRRYTQRPEGNRAARRQLMRNKQKKEQLIKINRQQICPFLGRIYYAINDTNDFQKDGVPKDREIVLYLWMNSTLKQIAELLRAHLPEIRTKQRFVFSRMHKEENKWIKKEMGTVMVHKRVNQIMDQRLDEHGFCIGDLIDVSINYK